MYMLNKFLNFVILTIFDTIYRPGPASTVGERPPTNPAIRVPFPPEADGFFFCCGNKCATSISSKKVSSAVKIVQRHLLERKSGLQFSLCTKKGAVP